MKIEIMPLEGNIEQYRHILEKNIDYDKCLNSSKDALELEIETLSELKSIFKGLESPMGYGHVIIDFEKDYVTILNSWIE